MPALAIADALRAEGAEVEFAGGGRAEAQVVPRHGYPFHELRVEGLDRRSPARAARAAGLAAGAAAKARRLLRRLGADAVIGGGGYVAGPVGLAAASMGLPLVLTEADSHLGISNRMLAPLADRVFLAFPLAGRAGPRYQVVGRPIPAAVTQSDPVRARERFGIRPDETCVLVFGGSLGARTVNEAALDAFCPLAPVAVLHVTGTRDHVWVAERLAEAGNPPHYRLESYVEPFGDAYAAADLAVARAGGSVFELAAAGLPSVLVPYPHATADHQAGNARWMADGGAAVVVADGELDGARLAREVGALVGSRERLGAMRRAALEIARPDAAERIARETLRLAAAPRRGRLRGRRG